VHALRQSQSRAMLVGKKSVKPPARGLGRAANLVANSWVCDANPSFFARRLLSSPGHIALPVAGHDAANRLDGVDDLSEAEHGDLRPHSSRVLVSTRQFGNIRDAAKEARVDAGRLFGDNLRLGLVGERAHVGRATEISPRTMRSKAKSVLGVE